MVTGVELPQAVLEARLVFGPIPRQKNEAKELHAPAEDWYPFERLFEDYVNVAMHSIGVCDPPQVEPVSVYLSGVSLHTWLEVWSIYLMVRDQNQPLWKVAF